MRSAFFTSAIFLFLACGCAAHAPSRLAPVDHDVLTQEQILEQGFSTALQVIQALRPNWLEMRGTDSFRTPTSIRVYFDGIQLGGIETLSSVDIADVVYIRHYDGVTATARWGVDHSQGVIYISTHPGSKPI